MTIAITPVVRKGVASGLSNTPTIMETTPIALINPARKLNPVFSDGFCFSGGFMCGVVNKRVQWDFSITLPALGIQGITAEPPLHVQGTHADIYSNPNDPNTLIKVTNDDEDA